MSMKSTCPISNLTSDAVSGDISGLKRHLVHHREPFVGRQVRATVAWLAVTIVAPALVLGLPLGIAAGRWGWRLFARYLAVVPEPIAPAAGTLIIAVAVVAVTTVIAAAPAQLAARVRPARFLRTE